MSGQTLQIDTQKRPSSVSIFPTNRVGEKSAREVNFTRQALLCLHYFLFLGYHRGAVPLHGTVDQGVVELLPNVNFVTPSRSDCPSRRRPRRRRLGGQGFACVFPSWR